MTNDEYLGTLTKAEQLQTIYEYCNDMNMEEFLLWLGKEHERIVFGVRL